MKNVENAAVEKLKTSLASEEIISEIDQVMQ